MRQKTLLATFVTLSFLLGAVFTTLVAATLAAELDLPIALGLSIGFTCLWSLLMWLVSPLIMDLIQRWVYKARNITLDELAQQRPAIAHFLSGVCQKHGIAVPRLKMIDDGTPQAYCYGSHAGNARLVVTAGLLHYLDDEEAKAVYAHELGHIVHRDFIVMTLASTLLQVLWNVYVVAKNVKGKQNSRPLLPIAVVALVFYWVGQYLLLFLSRSREYYADAFSAEETGNANALSMALIKIAYGLTRETPTPLAVKFMGGTRALGISDPKGGRSAGIAFQMSANGVAVASGQAYPAPGAYGTPGAHGASGVPMASSVYDGIRRIEKVLLFDLYNPWATVLEFASTHPLTGKRIRALCEQSSATGRAPLMNLDSVDAQGNRLDMTRMYSTFLFEVVVYFLPCILGTMATLVVGGLALFAAPNLAMSASGLIVAGVGLGMALKGFYRFGRLGEPAPTSTLALMSDPYASPMRGSPVRLAGVIVGRADAGNRIGEDFVLEATGGGLMPINYESIFGFLGNWFFSAKKLNTLMHQPVEVVGWFRRGLDHQVDLNRMQTGAEQISSYTAFWGRIGGVLLMLLGLGVSVGLWLHG